MLPYEMEHWSVRPRIILCLCTYISNLRRTIIVSLFTAASGFSIFFCLLSSFLNRLFRRPNPPNPLFFTRSSLLFIEQVGRTEHSSFSSSTGVLSFHERYQNQLRIGGFDAVLASGWNTKAAISVRRCSTVYFILDHEKCKLNERCSNELNTLGLLNIKMHLCSMCYYLFVNLVIIPQCFSLSVKPGEFTA